MNKYSYITTLVLLFSCSSSKQIVQTDSTPKQMVQTDPTSKQIAQTNLKDSQTFELLEISNDPTYGYSEKNPIQVGGVKSGPLNERLFLNALAGPNGEKVKYFRLGSCCPIESKNDPLGFGKVLLDNYRVTWEGSKDTVSIYISICMIMERSKHQRDLQLKNKNIGLANCGVMYKIELSLNSIPHFAKPLSQ